MNSPRLIFIIEDEPSIQDLVSIVLTDEGHRCIVASDSRALTEALKLEIPDLILLDIRLKGVPGTDLARKLKQDPRYRNIPIVLMSADSNIEEYSSSAHADAFLRKPFSITDLASTVRKFLPVNEEAS